MDSKTFTDELRRRRRAWFDEGTELLHGKRADDVLTQEESDRFDHLLNLIGAVDLLIEDEVDD